jgi:hypothetical protein
MARMMQLIEASFGLEEEALLKESARLLGFRSSKGKIREPLSRALQRLLEQRQVEPYTGGVRLVK